MGGTWQYHLDVSVGDSEAESKQYRLDGSVGECEAQSNGAEANGVEEGSGAKRVFERKYCGSDTRCEVTGLSPFTTYVFRLQVCEP